MTIRPSGFFRMVGGLVTGFVMDGTAPAQDQILTGDEIRASRSDQTVVGSIHTTITAAR